MSGRIGEYTTTMSRDWPNNKGLQMAKALDAQLHLSLRWSHIGHKYHCLMAWDDSRPQARMYR